ncbi:MAG: cupin domain-containing protein [Chloroflexota bacterium]
MERQKTRFNPNKLTFDEGLELIRQPMEQLGVKTKGRIITSRDEDVRRITESLRVTNVPDGFTKWMLPIYLESASQLYITVAEPNAYTPYHAHKDGDGIRFIASGSIIYDDKELTAGDWMFVPAGSGYEFTVGKFGAVMCYCYCCCCAGSASPLDDISNPVINPGN